MHGDVISFYVEPDNQHVIMTVINPDNKRDTVRVPKTWLTAMADAEPRYEDGPPQTPTPRPNRS